MLLPFCLLATHLYASIPPPPYYLCKEFLPIPRAKILSNHQPISPKKSSLHSVDIVHNKSTYILCHVFIVAVSHGRTHIYDTLSLENRISEPKINGIKIGKNV